MPHGSYDFQIDQTHAVIAFQPPLNSVPWAEIERVGDSILRDIEAHNTPPCVIDLSEQSQMGSAMVALIVRIWKSVKERNGRLAVVCRHPMVLQVIELAGLDKVWTIVPTREAAYQRLGVKFDSNDERASRPVAAIVSVLGLVAALAGLGLLLSKQSSAAAWQGLLFSGAGIGFIAGLAAVVRNQGRSRVVAVGALVLSVGVALFGCLHVRL